MISLTHPPSSDRVVSGRNRAGTCLSGHRTSGISGRNRRTILQSMGVAHRNKQQSGVVRNSVAPGHSNTKNGARNTVCDDCNKGDCAVSLHRQ